MKREGNEIKFNSDEQRRRFVRAVAIGVHIEEMIKAALATAAELREESVTWWRAAEQLCGPNERPVYDYVTETLRIETAEPKQSSPALSVLDYLREAKTEAIATGKFGLAGVIQELIDARNVDVEADNAGQ